MAFVEPCVEEHASRMRIHVLSDLHLKFAPFSPPDVSAEVIICAGDIHTGKNGLRWIRQSFHNKPVIYVLGNHEFYGQKIPKLTEELKAEAAGTNIVVLENDSVAIGDVTFLGATLWINFSLNGNIPLAEVYAQTNMTDFRRIRTTPTYRRFRPNDARRYFAASYEFLIRKTRELQGQKFVIVTHHAPSRRSVPENFKTNPLTPAYASNLDAFAGECGASAWIHGHIHTTADYWIGQTRVLSNPRGYPHELETNFNPSCVNTI